MKNIPIRQLNTLSEPYLSGSFTIRDLSVFLNGKDLVQQFHRHDFYYILALEKASGNHEIDFTTYPVGDHTVFFLRPGQVHKLMLNADSAGYLIGFTMEFYFPRDVTGSRLLRKASCINHYQLNEIRFSKMLNLLRCSFEENQVKMEGYQEVIRGNLDAFFIELIRWQGMQAAEQAGLYFQERLDRFLELLEIHVRAHKKVVEYADILNLSTYQLNNIAKTALGKNCSVLINEYLILEAKRQLLTTSDQVNQIAYALGYEDVSYFFRFFKKHTGYSPDTFRQNFK